MLHKEPLKRYAAAEALAEDLRRFQAGQPIAARPVSVWERGVKWARRRPAVTALLGTLFLVVVGGFLGMAGLWLHAQQQRDATAKAKVDAERQRDAAEAREAETRAVLDFVQGKVFGAARPQGKAGGLGRDVTLREAIEAALPFVEKSFTDQPLIEARLRMTLGISFSYLGEAKVAAEQYQAARTLYAKHRGPDHPDTLANMNNLANSYEALARHADALKLREDTLALRKAKLGPDHPDTLKSMNNLANSYETLGRHADALKLHEGTLALMKAKLGADHPDTLKSMNNLAYSYAALERHADALKLFETTLALKKAKLGPDHPDTLTSMASLAYSYATLGRHADALKLDEATLALMKAKLGPDHPDTLSVMHNLAIDYAALGRHADALKLHEETLALRKTKLGLDHPGTLWSMWGLAESMVNLDRGAEAVPVIDDCVRRAAGKVVGPKLLPSVMDLRLRHFEKNQDAAGCRQTAEMWEKLNRADAGSLYDAACMRAVTAALLRAADKSPDTAMQAAAETDRAMTWLKQAVAAGYKDAPHLAKDKDLDALRDRLDFKKLLAELEE